MKIRVILLTASHESKIKHKRKKSRSLHPSHKKIYHRAHREKKNTQRKKIFYGLKPHPSTPN
jgi:hypothetical protein